MSNPFEVIDLRLSAIELTLSQIQGKINFSQESKPELISLKEACQLLDLAPARLYCIHHKFFTVLKPGKKLKFLRSEIDAYLRGELPEKKTLESQKADQFLSQALSSRK